MSLYDKLWNSSEGMQNKCRRREENALSPGTCASFMEHVQQGGTVIVLGSQDNVGDRDREFPSAGHG